MKPTYRLPFAVALAGLFCLFAAFAFAQTGNATVAAPAVAVADNPLSAGAQSFIVAFAQSHAWLASLIALMGSMRLWAKPVFSFIHAVVDLTPSKSDDTVLGNVLLWFSTPTGSKVAYVIDWLTSIKIAKPTTPPPAP